MYCKKQEQFKPTKHVTQNNNQMENLQSGFFRYQTKVHGRKKVMFHIFSQWTHNW